MGHARTDQVAVTLQVAHTADVGGAALDAVRDLLVAVFADDFSGHDWDHCLGGMHAIAWEDGAPVGHAAVVQRRLLHGGRALRAGYVEGVAVRADRRRSGHGRAMMDALARIIRGAYDLGALGAADAAVDFYRACGWERWRGPTYALTPAGVVRTPDEDDSVYVLRAGAALDLDGEITCDWRDGDVW